MRQRHEQMQVLIAEVEFGLSLAITFCYKGQHFHSIGIGCVLIHRGSPVVAAENYQRGIGFYASQVNLHESQVSTLPKLMNH